MIDNFTDTELTNEVWRDIAGYEGMYQVSDLGRVRSLKYGKVRVLKPNKNKYGYLVVGLSKENKRKTVKVHRLVASAFIPNDDDSKTQINHRNEDKTENKVSNLEWCTAQYNLTYNDLHHRRKCRKPVRDKIKPLYNHKLSISDNIALFKEQGVECSRSTVIQLRRNLGLTKNKRDKLKPLYRPDLSIAENIELFKANGIDCSNTTVKQIRKELGLTNNKRCKLKDLYRPDLTIKQNIALFKEQGIECCRETVKRLRRDIGLTKPYSPRKKSN